MTGAVLEHVAKGASSPRKRPLLSVEDLRVSFSLLGAELHAVRGVSFELLEGEAVGIVGESGCGKSACAQAITRLSLASQISGRIVFEGRDLLSFSERQMRRVRGRKIGNVFQDPMTSLNPMMKIGAQIAEVLLSHGLASCQGAKERALELLEWVGIPEPSLRFNQYPHQLSGGMRQRVLIAIAIACRPLLVIADEPTTALDVTVQIQILALLQKMQRDFGASLLLITHDFGVISQVCHRILVFYAGKIVEQGTVEEVLNDPRHPYTQLLLRSMPKFDARKSEPLQIIDGAPPSLSPPPKGCAFAPRCPFAMSMCEQEPPFFGSSACWRENL